MVLRELIAKVGLDFDQRAFDKAENRFRTLKNVAVGLVGVFVASKVSGALRNIVVGSAEAADKLNDTAQAVGVTAQALQELGHAAELSGSSQEEMAQGLAFLSRNAFAAKNGSKEAQAAFTRLGVKLTDTSGRLRSADSIMMDVADGLSRMKSPTERTAVAMQVFGRSGARLVPLLNEGRAGIAKLRAEVTELGGAFSPEFIAQSDLFNDNMARLRLVAAGLKAAVGSVLVPTLNRMIESFLGWFKANRQIINQRIERWATALGRVFEKLVDIGRAFFNVVGALANGLTSLGPEIAIVAAIVGALALALGGTGLLVAILGAALVLLLDDIKVFVEGGDSLIGRLLEKWKTWVAEFTNPDNVKPNEHWLMTFLRSVVELLEEARKAVVDFFESFEDGKEFKSPKAQAILKTLGLVANPGEAVRGAASAYLGPAASPVGLKPGEQAMPIDHNAANAKLPWWERMARGAAESVFGAPAQAFQVVSPQGGAGGGANVSVKNEITVHGAPGQDEGVIADKVAAKVEERFAAHLSDALAAHTPAFPGP